MRIFDKDGRVNFVDDHNVLVGFDNSSNCCEDFGYFITKKRPFGDYNDIKDELISAETLNEFGFDTEFKHQPQLDDLDEGDAVSFRLTNSATEELFLTLYNSHNGYYSHGFSVECNGIVIKDGYR